MEQLSAQQIFTMPRLDTFKIPSGKYLVTYDDGVSLQVPSPLIVFNRYVWDLFKLTPQTPIVSKLCATKFTEKDGYNGDTHRQVLEAVFKYICDYNQLESYTQKEPYLKMIYTIVDTLQNEVLNMISMYVGTINALDFIQVVDEHVIEEIHKNLKPTPESVEKSYRSIKQYMNSASTNNRFSKAYKAKSINDNQANQCIGPRGFSSELDRTVFRTPITSGFIRGMSNLFELMAESCTAAKALNASGRQIQTSEYTSRRIQLLSMPVTGVVNGDCGSTEYWEVVLTPSFMENMKGIYYVKDDGGLDYIRGDEAHLINKLVKVRTAIGCRHQDPSKICSVCLGRTGMNFLENSNLGYTTVAHLMEKLTQAILSTKHLTHSVKKSMITLTHPATEYFFVTETGDLYIRPEVDLTGIQVILPNASMSKLVDVLNLRHTNVALSKIGELDLIQIKNNRHKVPIIDKVNIAYKDRNCVITKAFLEYIKTIEIESDSRGNFVISLDRFNKTLPIFNNPLKEVNIINFVNRISSIIESNKDKITDPYEKLELLMNTVYEKFKCNMTVLQVIVYATTAYNPLAGNYRLGRNSPMKATETRYNLFRHRSFSGLAVMQDQMAEIIKRPTTTFVPGNREPHPMSVFVAPQYVVK